MVTTEQSPTDPYENPMSLKMKGTIDIKNIPEDEQKEFRNILTEFLENLSRSEGN